MNRALLIGINEYRNVSDLAGCVNDVEDMFTLLTESGSVGHQQVTRLIDAQADRAAIEAGVKDLVAALEPGHRGWIHFSGHGVQLESTDRNEPDGTDEVLCPVDFDWTSARSIVDHEFLAWIAPLRRGAELVVIVDSCHSGDRLRAVRRYTPRTPTVPPEVATRLATRRSRSGGFRQVARLDAVAFASACAPWETAADTAFDDRPAGAFTHFLVRQAQRQRAGTVTQLVAAIEPDLDPFHMHPVVESNGSLVFRPPTQTRAVARQVRSTLASPPPTRAVRVIAEGSWRTVLAGQRLELDAQITAENGRILAHLLVRVLGVSVRVPPIQLTGDAQVSVPLGLLGAELEVSVDRWQADERGVRFDLAFEISTPLWFVPRVTVGTLPVVVASATRELSPVVASPADLVALATLAGQDGADAPAIRGFRDPWLQVVAAGTAGWGPSWREDRVIRPFVDRPRPDGIRRHSIELGPQRGKGNVYHLGFASAQETDFDFILHMGNDFFGGWGEIDWRVIGYNADIQPFPRQPVSAPEGTTNGHAPGGQLPVR